MQAIIDPRMFPLHRVPSEAAPPAPPQCEAKQTSGWDYHMNSTLLTLCKGHSKITCAMRARREHPADTLSLEHRQGFFCWIHRAYKVTVREAVANEPAVREWHAFCDPTRYWSGRPDDPLLLNTFSRAHNHFAQTHEDVRRYLFVHRLARLPPSLRRNATGGPSLGPRRGRSVAYLLHGDQVHRPAFNPAHGSADIQNFFTVQRVLARHRVLGVNSSGLAASMDVYPMAGANGMAEPPWEGNAHLWRALTSGVIHRAARTLPKGSQAHRRSHREAWNDPGSSAVVEPVDTLVLSPPPGVGILWAAGGGEQNKCPHNSAILWSLRRHLASQLDAILPSLAQLVAHRAPDGRRSIVQLFSHARNATEVLSTARARRRLVYVVTRAPPGINTLLKCHRCLWNVEALADAIAHALPGSTVLLANPGELPVLEQLLLFRTADVLVGVHGSGMSGWGFFLTPTQAVLELPLPGSPGLNDWLFASMGCRTSTIMACVPQAHYGRGCGEEGGDAHIPVVTSSLLELVEELDKTQDQPLVWHKLGWKPDSAYTGWLEAATSQSRPGGGYGGGHGGGARAANIPRLRKVMRKTGRRRR